MTSKIERKKLELIDESIAKNRPNRLCVSISDIHLTDGSVGIQNLGQDVWDSFYSNLRNRCRSNEIVELTFILDGDVIDMIRSDKWAKNNIYPWQRECKEDFSRIVNEIIEDIVGVKHKDFFKWLRDFPDKLKAESQVKKVKIVILLGNHDKELYCDQKALTYFYEKGLGVKLKDIKKSERQDIGRMYGDENMFSDVTSAPYFPFYYGDRGFRFFTTHGQWRDKENSMKVKAKDGLPAWSAKDGWQNEIWKQLKFSPFLLPCFGDTVAAGVLSTFIYKVKVRLSAHGHHDDRLTTIIEELDLYRPTYKALTRIIKETKFMRAEKCDHKVIHIIEDTLYVCIIDWLTWDFTYASSPLLRRIGLRIAKIILKTMKFIGLGLEIKAIAILMRMMNGFASLNLFKKKGVSFKELSKFPAFLPEYQHYGFQIHGEGHTHEAWEEEINLKTGILATYINFGTWRDQIIGRKKSGYRRRSVLRAFYILDLKGKTNQSKRLFRYYTDDIIRWSDQLDIFSRENEKY